jgi:hypothetical protein
MQEIPELYDVAKQICHEAGLPWTDPRTGQTHPPPSQEKPMREIIWSKPSQPDGTAIDLAGRKLASRINPHDAHIGVGEDELVVYVTRSKSVQKRLAAQITEQDGFPVRVQYIGKVRPA